MQSAMEHGRLRYIALHVAAQPQIDSQGLRQLSIVEALHTDPPQPSVPVLEQASCSAVARLSTMDLAD
jgi:hypothetical protein